MEQRRQDYRERQSRIAKLETELSRPTAGYRRQSATVMPGSDRDLAEYYEWRHAREQELAELRQRQQEVESDTLPHTARMEAVDIIRREAIAARPVRTNETPRPLSLNKANSHPDTRRRPAR